jgi:outer membrane protein
MNINHRRIFPPPAAGLAVLLFSLVICADVQAQHPLLDSLISLGLTNNPGIRQERTELAIRQKEMEIADRLHYPSAGILGTYTLAWGGRSINLPIGTLLNPVYTTLNNLTQSSSFSLIDNVEEQFTPNNFIDLKLRTSMPVINPELRLGREAARQQLSMQELRIGQLERALQAQIKEAFFAYLQAAEAVNIYKAARERVQEQYRSSELLLRNDLITEAPLLRARTELAGIEADIIGSERLLTQARARLNQLLNNPTDAPLPKVTLPSPESSWQQWMHRQPDASQRTEGQLLRQAYSLNQLSVQQASQLHRPRLNAFIDMGPQAFLNNFTSDAFLVLGGVQLEWPLWSGGRNHRQLDIARLKGQQLETKLEETNGLIVLQQTAALADARAAQAGRLAAQEAVTAAERYLTLVDVAYREGAGSYIEWFDARQQLTQAQLRRSIADFELWKNLAALEQAFQQ